MLSLVDGTFSHPILRDNADNHTKFGRKAKEPACGGGTCSAPIRNILREGCKGTVALNGLCCRSPHCGLLNTTRTAKCRWCRPGWPRASSRPSLSSRPRLPPQRHKIKSKLATSISTSGGGPSSAPSWIGIALITPARKLINKRVREWLSPSEFRLNFYTVVACVSSGLGCGSNPP